MNNHNEPKAKSLRDLIAEKIKHGEIKMHSRAYFFAQAFAVIVAIILIVILAIVVSSFLVFTLRASGRIFLPETGWHGIGLFLERFPWLILLIVVVLVMALELLVKRFSYKRPIVYTFGFILALIIVAGTVVGYTALHPFLVEQARENHLPPFANNLYRQFGDPHDQDINRGIVTNINANELSVRVRPPLGSINVFVGPMVDLDDIHVGDEVMVIGSVIHGEVNTDIIKKLQNDPFFEEVFEFGK